MSATRALLLAASRNQWLQQRARRYAFVRKSVSRFMPGETLDDAIRAAHDLKVKNVATVFTHLGENISNPGEAEAVVAHYLQVLQRLHAESLETELSVKLTQLGLDLSPELCERNLRRLFAAANPARTLWIDMESSGYVDPTLEIYSRILADYPNAGVCLQAYLYRTAADLQRLLPQKPAIRLVKGAYQEPATAAVQAKSEVDANYLALAQTLLLRQRERKVKRAAFATHDTRLIQKINAYAMSKSMSRSDVEIQMLYGIQRAEQERLAAGGGRCGVLIAYGTHWYAWFMRRLAERPANFWLVLRNLAGG